MAWRPSGMRPISGIPEFYTAAAAELANTFRENVDAEQAPSRTTQADPAAARPSENVSSARTRRRNPVGGSTRILRSHNTANGTTAIPQIDSAQPSSTGEKRSHDEETSEERPTQRPHQGSRQRRDSHRDNCEYNLSQMPFIRSELEHLNKRQRTSYLRRLALEQEGLYLTWIGQNPQDIDLKWKRPLDPDYHRPESARYFEAYRARLLEEGASGIDVSPYYDWPTLFGDWSWDRPVVEPPEADIGPMGEAVPS
ncbi:hypothetical protein LTR85_004564 [Meristemomyces frigidus]|nr:hypothetical protein LTR85_004564 [Meristemomyces frigidus]